MRKIFLNLVLGLVLGEAAWAQGTINFTAISTAPLDRIPTGNFSFYPFITTTTPGGGSSFTASNVLWVTVNMGSSLNADGWLLEMGEDSSLTPLFQLSNVPPPFSGGTYFNNQGSVELTDAQRQSYFSGKFYVQISFALDSYDPQSFDGSYLGQLVPVPEASSLALTSGAIGLFLLLRFAGVRKTRRF